MTFHFSLEYKTQWGEELRVIINGKEYPLTTYDGMTWAADIELKSKEIGDELTYKYAVYRDGELLWTEWEVAPHSLQLSGTVNNKRVNDNARSFILTDFWRPIPESLPLFSSAFTDSVASHEEDAAVAFPRFNKTLQLRMVEPRLLKHQHLAVCGNCAQLGNWETPAKMQLVALQEWGITLNAEEIYKPIEYKYVIINDEGKIEQWEEGPNRLISSLKLENGQTWVKSDAGARFSLHNWKCAGVVIPVFSLRTENSFGADATWWQ